MDPFVHQVAAEAHAAGHCHDCAICGKPFTAARQPKACGAYGEETRYPGQAVIYLLCRRCARLSRKEKIERLLVLGERALQRAYLVRTPAKGSA